MCATYLKKLKPAFLPWFIKRSSVHLTATLSNRNRFQIIFALPKPEKKMYKRGHAACVPQHSRGCRRAARASDLRVVRTGPVCCEPRHRRMEASSVAGCVDAEGGHFEHYL